MSILVNGILTGNGGGTGGGGGIPEAPSDGKVYGRKNIAWSPVENARYRHVQTTPAAVWNIQHNLGSKPVAVWTFDGAGTQIYGTPDHANATLNLISVTFCEPVSGLAYVGTLL
jgi:hypothetical protein